MKQLIEEAQLFEGYRWQTAIRALLDFSENKGSQDVFVTDKLNAEWVIVDVKQNSDGPEIFLRQVKDSYGRAPKKDMTERVDLNEFVLGMKTYRVSGKK